MYESSEDIKKVFETDSASIKTISDVADLRIKYLGRKGIINDAFSRMKSVADAEKKQYGDDINKLKQLIEETLVNIETDLLGTSTAENIDVTLPGKEVPQGSLHMVTYAIEEIVQIFTRLGFIRMSYPEVEWEHFAFEALNMPKGHPARDDFETFFIDAPIDDKMGKTVLTPHTSNGQVREMLRLKTPPIKMINIARTYRPNWDASHVPMFHQFEGLCIDKGINMTNLIGTIDYFAKEFFGSDRKIRLRPFHFQFTEPSFEVDITCDICDGTGRIDDNRCKICKSGWLELGGCGMVHRNVLAAGGIDADEYTGWAFGFGIERVMMMKEGLKLDDIRILYSGDIRFLEQF